MTGLYNGRGFVTLAEQHLRKVWRTKGVSLLLYADMDGLKKINDVYGHHEGSKAIVDIAEVLKKTFRESDIIARVGGDEFVIIATDADNRLVQEMLERLEQNLQKVNALGLTPYHLSLSVGVVTVNGSEQRSLEDLLKDADAAMYSNKYSKRQEIR
jgi:diguanylate cyclase (GGDEF)-like protein